MNIINKFISIMFVLACTFIGAVNTGYPIKGFVAGVLIVAFFAVISIKVGVSKSSLVESIGWTNAISYWMIGLAIVLFPAIVFGYEGWLPVVISIMLITLWNRLCLRKK